MKKSDSSTCSAESGACEKASKGRIKKIGNIYPSKGEQGLIISETGIAPAITSRKKGGGKVGPLIAIKDLKEITVVWVQSSQQEKGGIKTKKGLVPTLGARMGTGGGNIPMIVTNSSVSGPVITTSTPTKSIPSNSEKKTIIQATLRESIQKKSLTLISFVQDFLVNPSRWLARVRDSRIPVDRYSSRFPELRKLKDLRCYSWKTLKDFFQTTEDKPSRPFFRSWGVSDTGLNGKYLTASTTEFPRTGKECSLSDILEKQVDSRYFLSQKAIEYLQRAEERGRLRINFQQQLRKTSKEEYIQEEKL